MKVYSSPYSLKERWGSKEREGILLRIDFGEGRVGYGDCHPWPELGDSPLWEQVQRLREGGVTEQMRRAVAFARMDAEARFLGINLMEGVQVPPSHWLVASESAFPQGAKHLKVKVGKRVDEVAFLRSLPKDVKLRIDANGRFSEAEFLDFIDKLGEAVERVEFFEDPIPFDRQAWGRLKRAGLPLAYDGRTGGVPQEDLYDFLVVKPALQSVPKVSRPIVITTNLDHPIGQLSAAYIAATCGVQLAVCGLLSHTHYEPNAFSERLAVAGDRLIAPTAGSGFGFDDLLEEMPWGWIGTL